MYLTIKVKPNAKSDSLSYTPEGVLSVRIKAPPVDGKANAYLIKFLATFLDIPKSSIEIVQGESSSLKRLRVEGDESVLKEKLAKLVVSN